jgi:hypothetical protein
VIALGAVLAVAGCGTKSHDSVKPADKASAQAAASAFLKSPAGKQAENVVKGCEAKNGPDPLSKSNRTCIVPKGHGPAFVSCLLTAAGSDDLATSAGRASFGEAGVAKCAVDNR